MNPVGVSLDGCALSHTTTSVPIVLAIAGESPLANPHGIGAQAIVRALMRAAERGSLVTVKIDYFAAMLALGAPDGFAAALWSGGPATLGPYTLNLIPALCLWIKGPSRTIRVNDLQRWLPVDPAEATSIYAPESWTPDPPERWRWSVADYDRIVAHTEQTAAWCTEMATAISESLARASLPRYVFDGTGRVAGAILDRIADPSDITRAPLVLNRAIETAYAGGRINVLQTGSYDRVTQIDLRSAYPWAMTRLPSLAGASWVRKPTYDPQEPWGLWRVSWEIPEGAVSGPFPVRTQGGAIAYPLAGSGWYWAPEVTAAIACYGGMIHPADGFAIRPATDRMPFAALADIYTLRAELKASGDLGAAYAAKLALTSCYGRLAQAVQHNGQPGRWGNLALAGLTTAMVRARMLETLWEHERTAIALATDSLTVAGSLDIRTESALGSWGVETGESALMLPSGVFHVARGQAAMERVSGVERARAMRIDWPLLHQVWSLLGLATRFDVAVPTFHGLGICGATGKWGSFGSWSIRRINVVGKPDHAKPVRIGDRQWQLMPQRGKPITSLRYVPRSGAVSRHHDQENKLVSDVAKEHDQPFA